MAPDAAAVPIPLTGESVLVRRARAAIDLPGAGPLLIVAEEGLEPHSVARFVHERTRTGQPFLHVDCADPSVDKLHAAVLGERTRGTGHDLEALGPGSVLVTARRGTVFLENVGELPAAIQRGLARILRDGEARVGGRDRVRLSSRIIASAPPSLHADARGCPRDRAPRRRRDRRGVAPPRAVIHAGCVDGARGDAVAGQPLRAPRNAPARAP
jgi:DNA-binding NtrC family response regulator